ncbi:hypothetical protein M3589_15085 [Heyndrickxia oleronia]|uniref:hypothetical protein n=1 Tax=Heyndrickxia oleronia TaxID=38875 RepID=UPI00203E6449|nr:hypothetical protein [Heyndrickxia oleronia]MCM3239047.1 hypothetical protein [Heyndrickxia oleronia]
MPKLTTLFDFNDKMSRKLKTLTGNFEHLQKKTKKPVTVRAVDYASKTIRGIDRSVNRLASKSYRVTVRSVDMATKTIGSIRRSLTSIPSMVTVGLAFVGIDKLNDATLGAAMNFEQYEVSMDHWLKGNKKKSKELITWMGRLADKTPFSSPDLFPALTRGVGVSNGDTKEAKRLLKLSTDMAALNPEKTVGDAMEALADAKVGEFARLTEFNVKMSKESYKAIGGWSNFLKLMEKGNKKMVGYAGGAEKLANTAVGKISTLKGYISALFRESGSGILTSMKPRLDKLIGWIDNNQVKWTEWKTTVQTAGKQASEWVFSKFESGFNYIRSNYLDNDKFKKLDFEGKIKFILGDINKWWTSTGKPALSGWWDSTGQPWAVDIGVSMGKAIFSGIVTGAKEGINSIGDMWKDALKNPNLGSLGGALTSTLLAGGIGSMLLAPIFKTFKGGYKAGKGIYNVGKSAKDKFTGGGKKKGTNKQKKSPTSRKGSDKKTSPTKKKGKKKSNKKTPPTKKVGKKKKNKFSPTKKRSKVKSDKNSSKKPSKKPKKKSLFSKAMDKIKMPKALTKMGNSLKKIKMPKVSKVAKKIPFLGALIGGAEILSAKGAKGKGKAAGGTAGSFIGGGLGSLLGPLGTIAGAAAGGWLGEKFGGTVGSKFEPSKPSGGPKNASPIMETPPNVNMQDYLTTNVYQPLNQAVGNATKFGQAFGDSFVLGVNSASQTPFNWISEKINQPVLQAITNANAFGSAFSTNFVLGLNNAQGTPFNWISEKINQPIIQAIGNANAFGSALGTNFVLGLQGSGQSIHPWISSAIYIPLNQAVTNGFAFGSAIVQSIINGVSSKISVLQAQFEQIAVMSRQSASTTVSKSGPKIPMYANGGRTNGISIAGEKGPEWVIPTSGDRNRNISLWRQAGQEIGATLPSERVAAATQSNKSVPQKAVSGIRDIILQFTGDNNYSNEMTAQEVGNIAIKAIRKVIEDEMFGGGDGVYDV